MKILIICSKAFYKDIKSIKEKLEIKGHKILLPNCYDNPNTENEMKNKGIEEHLKFKAAMFKQSEEVIKGIDAVLVLNFEKNNIQGYIGGATFLEMYDAFRLNKKIFMFNPIPNGILEDEIKGFNPFVINGKLDEVK